MSVSILVAALLRRVATIGQLTADPEEEIVVKF
jgi:hypothetical protein